MQVFLCASLSHYFSNIYRASMKGRERTLECFTVWEIEVYLTLFLLVYPYVTDKQKF